MTKIKPTPKIKNRINLLKANGKKLKKDYFLTDNGDLIIKKRDYNEIVRAV